MLIFKSKFVAFLLHLQRSPKRFRYIMVYRSSSQPSKLHEPSLNKKKSRTIEYENVYLISVWKLLYDLYNYRLSYTTKKANVL